MAIKATVRMGGAADSDLLDITPQLAVFDGEGAPQMDAGMKFENGASDQFQLIIDDDDGEIPTYGEHQLAAHNQVTVSEDAPGYEAWLSRGRIARTESRRSTIHHGNAIGWIVTVDDGNADLKGLNLVESWVRPAETGRARVLAALAAFCDGSPRLTTTIENHLVVAGAEVAMPAVTYAAGTALAEIFEDCAGVEGKDFGVVIHHDSGASHHCFLYRDSQDYTAWVSPISIDDTDWDLEDVYPPIWAQGSASIREGQDLLTGLVSKYGEAEDSFVFVEDTADIERYDYWVDTYNDSVSVTAGQAATRAERVRHSHSIERLTQQVSIKIRADRVDEICAGMTISIRAAASMAGENLGFSQPRQIALLKWEPIAPDVGEVVGWYYAHMQLDRPLQMVAEKRPKPGPKPPTDDAPALLRESDGEVWNSDAIKEVGDPFTVSAGGGAIYAAVLIHPTSNPTVYWYPDGHLNPGEETFTQIATVSHPSAMKLALYRLLDPTPGTGEIQVAGDTGGTGCGFWYFSDINQANPNGTPVTATGTSASSSVSVTPGANGTVIDAAGWGNNDINPSTNPTPGVGQVEDVAGFSDASPGNHDVQFGASHGDSTPTWSWGASRNWCAITVAVNGTLGTGDTITGGPNADPGDNSGTYAPIDHDHDSVDNADAAGGDLSGTYPSPTVDGIQGISVPAPDSGDDGMAIVYDHDTTSFVYAAAGATTASGLTTRFEYLFDGTGSALLDGNGDPIYTEVAN